MKHPRWRPFAGNTLGSAKGNKEIQVRKEGDHVKGEGCGE